MVTPLRIIVVGLLAGLGSEVVLGILFANPVTMSVLYNPAIQGQAFLSVTPHRDLLASVTGLVVLSVIHAWLYVVLSASVPGRTWLRKGLSWGVFIWLMYWVFQEWFIYHTLLDEPYLLNALELVLLLVGSLIEGMIIAFGFREPAADGIY
ncbi:MAG TPA: hypothetical protein VFP46_01265 [Candidatus Paceibacterota bacterium]|nr:hypothetical protein [Candidatus Paceibacterota bacterium]